MYPLLRDLLFNFDAEGVHHFSMNTFKMLNKWSFLQKLLQNNLSFQHHKLQKKFFGIYFPNPVGLGAGFDKNALYLKDRKSVV